jgi:hypothetical protein
MGNPEPWDWFSAVMLALSISAVLVLSLSS